MYPNHKGQLMADPNFLPQASRRGPGALFLAGTIYFGLPRIDDVFRFSWRNAWVTKKRDCTKGQHIDEGMKG